MTQESKIGYVTPVNSPSASVSPSPPPPLPTREELKIWGALVSYIKHGSEGDLFETALTVLLATYQEEKVAVDEATVASQLAQDEARAARLQAQHVLNHPDAQLVSEAMDRLIQAVGHDLERRSQLHDLTREYEVSRTLVESYKESLASNLAGKKVAEAILMNISSLGVFCSGNRKDTKHLVKHLSRVLGNASFQNITTVAFIPQMGGQGDNIETARLEIAEISAWANKIFEVRASKSPPGSPALSPTPSPPKEESQG